MSLSTSTNRVVTDETLELERVLRLKYPDSEAYRYNCAAIRARAIDPAFRGLNAMERESLVEPLIQQLSEEIQGDLTLLLLLTPEEVPYSSTNVEFEHPTPSDF